MVDIGYEICISVIEKRSGCRNVMPDIHVTTRLGVSVFDASTTICRDVYAPPCDATLVLRAVFIQSVSRRRISNMFDIKDKSSQANNRVVTCMPEKTNSRRRVASRRVCRYDIPVYDVYAGTISPSTTCMPVRYPRLRRVCRYDIPVYDVYAGTISPSATCMSVRYPRLRRVCRYDIPVYDVYDLTRFNKIANPNNKFQMAKWTRKPLAYRESNNFLINV